MGEEYRKKASSQSFSLRFVPAGPGGSRRCDEAKASKFLEREPTVKIETLEVEQDGESVHEDKLRETRCFCL